MQLTARRFQTRAGAGNPLVSVGFGCPGTVRSCFESCAPKSEFRGSCAPSRSQKVPCWHLRSVLKRGGGCTNTLSAAPTHTAGTFRSFSGSRWNFVHFPQNCVGLRSAFSKNLKKSATQPALSVRTLKKPRKTQNPLFPERFGCGRVLRSCFVHVWIVLPIA